MTRDELKEKVARALAAADSHLDTIDVHWAEYREGYIITAEDALAAIEAAGLAIVPVEATPEIVCARAPGADGPMIKDGEYYFRNRKQAGAFASQIYRAMIEAGRLK